MEVGSAPLMLYQATVQERQVMQGPDHLLWEEAVLKDLLSVQWAWQFPAPAVVRGV